MGNNPGWFLGEIVWRAVVTYAVERCGTLTWSPAVRSSAPADLLPPDDPAAPAGGPRPVGGDPG